MVCSECECVGYGHIPVVLRSLLNSVKDVLEDNGLQELFVTQANLLKELYENCVRTIKEKEENHIYRSRKKIEDKIKRIKSNDGKKLNEFLKKIREYKERARTITLRNTIEEGLKIFENNDDVSVEIKSLKEELEKKKEELKKLQLKAKKLEYYIMLTKCVLESTLKEDDGSTDSTKMKNFKNNKFISISALRKAGYLSDGKKCNINSSQDQFYAFDKCDILPEVYKSYYDVTLEEISHNVFISRPRPMSQKFKAEGEIYMAISHNGLLGIYIAAKEQIEFTYLTKDKEKTTTIISDVSEKTCIGFYDDYIFLLKIGKKPEKHTVENIIVNKNFENIVDISPNGSELPNVKSYTDTSRLQSTRELIYPSETGISIYNVDENNNQVVEIKNCVGIISQFGISISNVRCLYSTDEGIYCLHKNNTQTKIIDNVCSSEEVIYGCMLKSTKKDTESGVSTDDTKMDYNLSESYWVLGGKICTFSENKKEDKKKIGLDFAKGISFVRVFKDVFLLPEKTNNMLSFVKIAVGGLEE